MRLGLLDCNNSCSLNEIMVVFGSIQLGDGIYGPKLNIQWIGTKTSETSYKGVVS